MFFSSVCVNLSQIAQWIKTEIMKQYMAVTWNFNVDTTFFNPYHSLSRKYCSNLFHVHCGLHPDVSWALQLQDQVGLSSDSLNMQLLRFNKQYSWTLLYKTNAVPKYESNTNDIPITGKPIINPQMRKKFINVLQTESCISRSELPMWLSGKCGLNVHMCTLPTSSGLPSDQTRDSVLGDRHVDLKQSISQLLGQRSIGLTGLGISSVTKDMGG